jgi:cytochrome P450
MDPNFQDKGDLISILLNDPITRERYDLIIDECMTFFAAGAFTTSMTTSNIILHLCQPKNSNYLNMIREEI